MAAKRSANVSVYSDDSSCSDDDYCPSPPSTKRFRQSVSSERSFNGFSPRSNQHDDIPREKLQKRKCTSKNAIVARENRMKKKMYVNGLEKQISSLKGENKNMKMTLSSQLDCIKELKNEITYLRNVLANSKEIGSLIGTICNSTSLQLKSPLDMSYNGGKTFSIRKQPIARKTAWPFQQNLETGDPLTPSTSISSLSPHREDEPLSPLNVDVNSYFSDDYEYPQMFNDIGLPTLACDDITDNFNEKFEDMKDSNENSIYKPTVNAFPEHNYSKISESLLEDSHSNYGVCLHISNKKLSLEFCSQCNEKAVANWDGVTH